MDEYEVYYERLVGDLHGFHQSFRKRPLSGLLAQSSLAVPAPLLAQVHNISLLSRGHSSRIDNDGDSRDTTHITSYPHVFPYDLGSTHNTRLLSLRSEVAQLYKAPNNIIIDSDDLDAICVIYNLIVTMSALDDDPLSGFQTSWVVVRQEVIRRWE